MSIAQSYKISADAKQHTRLKGAFRRFQRLLTRINVQRVGDSWYMARVSGLVSFACTEEVARKKIEQALRNQLLSGLRVVQ